MTEDYNFLDDWSLGDEEQPTKEATPEPDEQPTVKRAHLRHAACIELSERYLYRRAFSEVSLLDILPKASVKDTASTASRQATWTPFHTSNASSASRTSTTASSPLGAW